MTASRPQAVEVPDRVLEVQPLAAEAGDPAAHTLSDGLAMAVEREVVGTGTPVRIANPQSSSDKPQPALFLRGNATSRGGRLRANVALVANDDTVIWSGTFERPSLEAGAMTDQLGLQVARE